MPLSTSAKNTILNGLVGKSDAFGSSVYVGLSSTEPTVGGGNINEPSGNGYARVLVGVYNQSGTHKFGTPVDGVIRNDEIIYFPESTGTWGDPLRYFVLFTSSSGGTVLGFAEITNDGTPSPVTVNTDKTVVMFRTNMLAISFEDPAEA